MTSVASAPAAAGTARASRASAERIRRMVVGTLAGRQGVQGGAEALGPGREGVRTDGVARPGAQTRPQRGVVTQTQDGSTQRGGVARRDDEAGPPVADQP